MKIIALVVSPLLLIALIIVAVFWRSSVSQVVGLNQELQKAQSQIAALETQTKNIIQKADGLTATLKESESKLDRATSDLKAKNNEINSLKDSNSRLTMERSSLTREANQKAAAQKTATEAKAEATAYRERLANQEATLLILTQERDKLSAELEQAKKTINLLDLNNSEVVSSLGFLGRPVFTPEALPPFLDHEFY
ncbi:MAG: hypothetical protein LBI10_01595 [Deltaproteobacteria bacterium]|jgi:chromosome segregation ATPase|nr:hypothetical protein [Deltaproteobacteria bacterium]